MSFHPRLSFSWPLYLLGLLCGTGGREQARAELAHRSTAGNARVKTREYLAPALHQRQAIKYQENSLNQTAGIHQPGQKHIDFRFSLAGNKCSAPFHLDIEKAYELQQHNSRQHIRPAAASEGKQGFRGACPTPAKQYPLAGCAMSCKPLPLRGQAIYRLPPPAPPCKRVRALQGTSNAAMRSKEARTARPLI